MKKKNQQLNQLFYTIKMMKRKKIIIMIKIKKE
jgi:hypothetical protein